MKCITGSLVSSADNSQCTHYRGEVSTVSEINASVIRDSSIGPASYVVNTWDLQAVTPGNVTIKFADDTYLIIPAANANSRQSEVDNVELWSWANNLKVNPTKYAEMIVVHNKRKALKGSSTNTCANAEYRPRLNYESS